MTGARMFIALGGILAFVAVAAGAFGAHLLKTRLSSEFLAVFETGVRYQFYHALGLIAVGLTMTRLDGFSLQAAGWLFVAGTVIFSGSLYGLSLSGTRWLGAVTPIGGVCFLAGWALFVYGVLAAKGS